MTLSAKKRLLLLVPTQKLRLILNNHPSKIILMLHLSRLEMQSKALEPSLPSLIG